MLLVIDIGNTNITLGIYEQENLVKIFRLTSNTNKSIEYYKKSILEYTKAYDITDCIIASVVDGFDLKIKKTCDEIFGIDSFIFNSACKTGVFVTSENLKSVGVDRIANAYASYLLYPQPSIVVDVGSATTFDIVSCEGAFIGGLIMPGINMQLNSLCEKTSKLPKIEIEEVDNVIGTDTKSCILSGVIRGQACAIEGLIEQCEKELKQKVTLISTGGLNSYIVKYMNKKIDYINSELTLLGLKKLYELNVKS